MEQGKASFIKIGNVRIKYTNIKSYKIDDLRFNTNFESDIFLVISTYQNDIYTFSSDMVDIYEIVKQLDERLCE